MPRTAARDLAHTTPSGTDRGSAGRRESSCGSWSARKDRDALSPRQHHGPRSFLRSGDTRLLDQSPIGPAFSRPAVLPPGPRVPATGFGTRHPTARTGFAQEIGPLLEKAAYRGGLIRLFEPRRPVNIIFRPVNIPGAEAPMANIRPWHSSREIDRKVCHDDTRCPEGNTIQQRYRRDGTRGWPKCEQCQGFA
jgi:hypothetical protein